VVAAAADLAAVVVEWVAAAVVSTTKFQKGVAFERRPFFSAKCN
jgi:hypothetical protein